MQLEIREDDIRKVEADTLVINLFEGVEAPGGASGAVDEALGGALHELVAAGDATGRLGETTVLYPRGALPVRRVLVTGLGPSASFGAEAARLAAAAAARRALELGGGRLATVLHGAGAGGLEPERAAQATVEGSLLAAYRFEGWKRQETPPRSLASLVLVEADAARAEAARRGAATAEAIARGVTLARDLVNRPPNVADPAHLADAARSLAERHGMRVHVGDRAWAAEQSMGAFLAVAEGSAHEPAFIELELNAGAGDLPTVVLVGKGVTFDSGGLSLKTRDGMIPMKSDMAGAAAVLGALEAAAELELPLHLIGLCPCVENMPDGGAYRPSDVLVASNGLSIEVLSTDAEGRLALADALAYAQRFEPNAVIDLATLTGSCVVALGSGVAAGLFSNDDHLRDRLVAAGQQSHERVWPLPLYEDYRTTIDSTIADLKNSGGREGGVGTSAAFLQAFVRYPWAHLDIAGMALTDRNGGYRPEGATGFGVRLLTEALRHW
ncbi:MAG: leucyl aminopeptidase [Deinococcales bacterium]